MSRSVSKPGWFLRLLLVALAASACFGPTEDGSDPTLPAGFTVPEPGSYRMLEEHDLVHPVIQLMGLGMQESEFHNIIESAAAQCMQLRGWTYEPVLMFQADWPRTVGEHRAWAQAYGFGIFVDPPSPSDEPQRLAMANNAERVRDMAPEEHRRYRLDYDGSAGEGAASPGSCVGLAQAAMGSVLFDEVVFREMGQMTSAAMKTPQALAVDREYAECMADLGYDFELPGHAQNMIMELHEAYLREEVSFEQGHTREVEVATDSFECELMTRITWRHHVEAEIVRYTIERYPEYALEGR